MQSEAARYEEPMLPLPRLLPVLIAFIWVPARAADAPKGERVFFTGHSFHMFVRSGTAVVRLRELLAEGKVPGIAKPSQLFRDDIGHANEAVSHLVIYVNFATLDRRTPAGLPGLARSGTIATAPSELESLLKDIAWKTVITEPLSGVAMPPPAQ